MKFVHSRFWFAVALFVAVPWTLRAEVGDPTLQTDHPQYAGEGAFQTVEDCVRFATQGRSSPQERALALYSWILTHQFHLASPQEWNVPGMTPDVQQSQDDLIVQDANRARFSYSYGLCGTVHAWNETYWKALGMPARRRAFPGHVNSEIFYDNGWSAFDTDMAGLLFRDDGRVAGYDDIQRNPALATQAKPPIPCYPFAWPDDFEVMKQGWRQVAQGGDWYVMYNAGYAALPGVVRLRSGETFTRWFDRDHWGGPAARRFWHHQPGGPFRNWTFVNQGEPKHQGAESNSRGNASYCNGEFIYQPDLSHATCFEGAVEKSANLVQQTSSPRLFSRDQQAASVTFEHFSPYVICGDPEDDANPMTGKAIDGVVVSGDAVGVVTIDVSADHGQTWRQAGEVRNAFSLDLTEHFKGRYGWRIRLTYRGQGGLDRLEFRTITQVAQTIYPRLKPGGSQITYRAGNRGVTPMRPNFALPEENATWEVQELRSSNVKYRGRGPQSRLAYEVQGNKPGIVAFRVTSPQPLQTVNAAVRYSVRSPSPPNCDFHLDVSTDQGQTWRTFARSDVPADNEFSSGWVYGVAEIPETNVREAIVRAHLYAGGYPTGLIDAEFYGLHATTAAQSLELTYGWREGDQAKTHKETIPADATEHRFQVATGETIVDDFVRLAAP